VGERGWNWDLGERGRVEKLGVFCRLLALGGKGKEGKGKRKVKDRVFGGNPLKRVVPQNTFRNFSCWRQCRSCASFIGASWEWIGKIGWDGEINANKENKDTHRE
jgi:hypothetical protein